MYDELNERLARLREEMQRRNRKQPKLRACQLQLSEARSEVTSLREGLSDKQHVLDKLNGLSLLHLMAVIKGIEDVEEEKIHREAARLNGKLTTAVALVERLEADENQLKSELKLTDGIEQTYHKLLHEKEQAIAASADSPVAQQLLEYTHREADFNVEVKETQEALTAAGDAAGALRDCMDSLRKAQNWGTMDMLGGGTITTMIKRSHMDDAQSKMDNASYYLSRLQRELQDLDEAMTGSMQLHKDGFLHFADYFFDGLFVDWAVQNQIKDAASKVDEQYQHIGSLTQDLQGRLKSLKQKADDVLKARLQLVEKA